MQFTVDVEKQRPAIIKFHVTKETRRSKSQHDTNDCSWRN